MHELYAPNGILVSYFAIQPIHDLENTSRNLFRVTSQPGVQILRQTFSAIPRKSKTYSKRDISYTGLSLIVRVYFQFAVRTESTFPTVLRHVRKEFLKRRTLTYTILSAAGFKVTIIKGDQIFKLHFRNDKIKEGISIFPFQAGSESEYLDRFLRLERVPSRYIQDFAVPDLPVTHRVGHRIDDPTVPVGFGDLSSGSVLMCGSDKNELISIFQNLINSFAVTNNKKGIFVIDTHNEFNGLIRHLQSQTSSKQGFNLHLFQLGTNMFINLCDVIIPPSPSGKRQESKAIEAWRAHLVSNILLSSLPTSDYFSSRFAVPLETQIRNAAKGRTSFTLEDVKTTFGNLEEEELESSIGSTDGVFADLMSIEHLNGILDQFKAFKEVNYSAFFGHLSNLLYRDDSITIFQFGAQPPMIKRAVVAFLLQYLGNLADRGFVFFPHADEFLSRRTFYGRIEAGIPTVLIDACNSIAQNNVLILGSQSVQALALKVNLFEQIKDQVYLRLVNAQDRELIITQHQLKVQKSTKLPMFEKQVLGIREGEGLLFRGDTSLSTAFHFKTDSTIIPVDLHPIKVTETKMRGSKTFGLVPTKFAQLMKILKILAAQPLSNDTILDELEINDSDERLLTQMSEFGLCKVKEENASRTWEITVKGLQYQADQHTLMENLPSTPSFEEINLIRNKITTSEKFFDRSVSNQKSKEENAKIKDLVGQMLSYLFTLTGNIPWIRYAEYTDLKEITGIEGQDFRQLYALAYEICQHILNDIKKFREKNKVAPLILESTAISDTGKLDDFLPDDRYVTLQKISKSLNLKRYPDNGILDIHFKFLKKGKNLIDELKENPDGN